MKNTLLITLFTVTHLSLMSQEIRGKASKAPSREESTFHDASVSYGTVEAYDKNNKLVRSVLTDAEGKYNISFSDTGTYTIKIKYAGFETMADTVSVTGLKDLDFEMERDYSKKTRTLAPASYGFSSGSSTSSSKLGVYSSTLNNTGIKAIYNRSLFSSHKNIDRESKEELTGLTAGEINDFAKWDMWNDIANEQLSFYQKAWQLNPSGRYMVQAINKANKPLVGAKVELLNNDIVIWKSVTDNTGKAELWGSINGNNTNATRITITYKDEKKTIKKPTVFKEGINTILFETPCDVSNNAEIAFVVDATGSMQDEINFIKRDLNKVIYNTKESFSDVNIRFASVFYRDKTDAYLTKNQDFTSVLSEALVYIDEQDAAGGGDNPEAVDEALEVAINKLSWSEDTRAKLIFLILDAPAHDDDQTIKKIQALIEKASEKGIKIIPVTGSGLNKSGEYLTRAMALGTNGKYIFLTNHSGIGNEHIEPNTDEYDVNLLTEVLSETIDQNLYYPSCDDTIPQHHTNYPDSSVSYQHKDSAENTLTKIEWNFYPNPTTDELTIEVSELVDFIYLTDISGKILEKIPFNDTKKKQISLIQYPTGLYLLRYPIGKQWMTGKVVLTR